MRKAKSNMKAQPAEPAAVANPKPETKAETVIALLRRPEGATIAQMMQATGWQAHTIRGFMAGALKKNRKLTVTSEKTGAERVYRLAPEPKA